MSLPASISRPTIFPNVLWLIFIANATQHLLLMADKDKYQQYRRVDEDPLLPHESSRYTFTYTYELSVSDMRSVFVR